MSCQVCLRTGNDKSVEGTLQKCHIFKLCLLLLTILSFALAQQKTSRQTQETQMWLTQRFATSTSAILLTKAIRTELLPSEAVASSLSLQPSAAQVYLPARLCLSTQPLGQPDGSSAPWQLRTRHTSQNNERNLLHPNLPLLHHPWQDLPAPFPHPPHLLCVSSLQTQTKHCHHSDRRSGALYHNLKELKYYC